MSIILVILIIVIIVFFVFAFIYGNKKDAVDELCIKELQEKGIHLDNQINTESGIIGIDLKAKKIILTTHNISTPEYKIFDFEDIYSCELLKDNETISRKSTTRTIGGAIVGGIIGGGAGTIVGGLSGSSKSQMTASLIELKIVVRDIESPTHKITFYDKNRNLNWQVQALSSEAEKWKDRINLIIEQTDLENEKQTTTKVNGTIADELAKLHELKQNGILTGEEFDSQKKKLLGL